MITARRILLVLALALTGTLMLFAAGCESSSDAGAGATPSATVTPVATGPVPPSPSVTPTAAGSSPATDGITALAARGDNVWLAVGDVILESADNGADWREVSVISGGAGSLSFTSATDGWASTANGLLHTVDGGTTWRGVTAAPSGARRAQFVDAQHGWMTGSNGNIERTEDAGGTWEPLTDPCAPPLQPLVSFVDDLAGWLLCPGVASSGAQSRELYRTTDAGATWTLFSYTDFGSDRQTPSVRTLPDTGYAQDLFFLDDAHGWIAGQRQNLESTTAAAQTWQYGMTPAAEVESESDDVVFVSPAHGYFVSLLPPAALYATVDAGGLWTKIYAVGAATSAPPDLGN